jgi:hypothetical protein
LGNRQQPVKNNKMLHFCNTAYSTAVPNYTEPNFNRQMELLLKARGLDYVFMPCALGRPIVSSRWNINLPEIPPERWRRKNFRLVIHAQDFVHFFGDLCVELHWLEQQFTPDQQSKIIFVAWDHRLRELYQGNIRIVNFVSHSYELVHQLKSRWSEWRDVHNKKIQHNWMCLNGRAREYRQEVYNLLRHEQSGFVSHSIFNPIKSHPYQDYNFNNVDNFIKLIPIYQSARSSIVTESLYQDVGGIVTEKTLLAIAAKHPFLCIGHRYCHEDVNSLGFENYNELFDLTHDIETCDTRMYSAVEKNIGRLQQDIDLDLVCAKIDQNFDYLMGDFADRIQQQAAEDLRILFEKKL